MAKSRKKAPQPAKEVTIQSENVIHAEAEPVEPEPVEPEPDVFDRQISILQQEVARKEVEPAEPEHRQHASGFIANPSSKRRESHVASVARKMPSKLTIVAGDLKVQMLDKGDNLAGIGVMIEAQEGRKLTEAEKSVIREHMKYEGPNNPPFTWNQQVGLWLKPIVRENEFEDQVPPSRPVAVRLDAERRCIAIAEDLRQLQADPAGFADMVKARREQAADAGRIPD